MWAIAILTASAVVVGILTHDVIRSTYRGRRIEDAYLKIKGALLVHFDPSLNEWQRTSRGSWSSDRTFEGVRARDYMAKNWPSVTIPSSAFDIRVHRRSDGDAESDFRSHRHPAAIIADHRRNDPDSAPGLTAGANGDSDQRVPPFALRCPAFPLPLRAGRTAGQQAPETTTSAAAA